MSFSSRMYFRQSSVFRANRLIDLVMIMSMFPAWHAIQEKDPEVVLIDCTKKQEVDMLGYDRIGFASGIYYGSFAKQLLSFAQINLLDKKEVFFLFTCGSMSSSYTNRIREIAEAKEARILGEYGCFGFDTFGPFKIVGGIKKGHPTDEG